ncbi:MAG TPA: CHASE2 domain-containing protein [Deltaproteobacteria bacterium]|nr:CHASE2 domain-containing protein [Deltaproteobacteria bacterium]
MRKIKESTFSDFRHGIILTLLGLLIALFFWPPLERIEYSLYDVGARLRVKSSVAPVAVIAIDEKSIANFGPWPWPRSYIGFMIDLLDAYDARVIGLDIIYSDKDMNRGLKEVLNIIQTIEDNPQYSKKNISTIILLAALKDAEKRLDNDAILADSLAMSDKVILPLHFNLGREKNHAFDVLPDFIAQNALFPFWPDNSLPAYEMTAPLDIFSRNAQRLGHMNIVADSDGTVRSDTVFIKYGNYIFPSLALQLALAYFNIDLRDIDMENGLNLGPTTIPLVDGKKMLITYKTDIPYYSFLEVINKTIPAEAFKDKVVIIAPSTVALGDLQVTPATHNVPSVKIIANSVDNILTNDFITRPDWAYSLELMLIFFFGLYVALVVPRLRVSISAVLSALLLAASLATGVYFMAVYGYWIKAVYPSLVLLIGYAIIISKRYQLIYKDRHAPK